jgi:hypothetical protein
MAEPNLSPFFVPASNETCPVRTLHFVGSLDQKRELYRFVCESQPLMTLTSHGLPKRCPLCGQNYPIRSGRRDTRGETNAHQQG